MDAPSTNGSNGELTRTTDGRFAKGNAGGPGNPIAKRSAEIRAAFTTAVTPDDLQAVVKCILDAAKAGDLQAGKIILDRVMGNSTVTSVLQQAEWQQQHDDEEAERLERRAARETEALRQLAQLGVRG